MTKVRVLQLVSVIGYVLLSVLATNVNNIVFADTPSGSTNGVSAGSAPIIDVWYGSNQAFSGGTPQQWINIVGNVSDVDGDLDLVEYALNDGGAVQLTVGPDNRRLLKTGDFNIELDISAVNNGENTVVITATDTASPANKTVSTVNFSYDATAKWSLPESVSWSAVSNPNDLVQVVDGKWSVSAAGARIQEVGYDRVIALGDVTWTDYEAIVPITVHSTDSSAYGNPYSVGPGLGLIVRWQGHTNDPIDCTVGSGIHCGWNPQGANPWYEWTQNGSGDGWRLDSNTFSTDDPLARRMVLNTSYIWKVRGQTTISGTLYQFKVWEEGTAEPGWQMSGVDTVGTSGYLDAGSFLLVAHHADATFGDIQIQPVFSPTLTVEQVGLGDVTLSPPGGSYTYGTEVTLSATADPGYVFNRWDGDLSGSNNPASIVITGDKVVKATFSQLISYTLSTSASIGGEVSRNPDQSEYLTGTLVALNAVADVGWHFSNWSGDISGIDNPYSVMMNTDKTVQGNFNMLPADTFSSDDFDGCALDSAWTHIPGLVDASAPVLVGNTVVLTVPAGAIHSFDGDSIEVNRIVQSVGDTDFELIAKFDSIVTQKYQTQGIVVEAENGDVLRLEVFYDGSNRVYAEKILGGVVTPLHNAPVSPNQTPPYLKIARSGDQWTYSYSFNGIDWTSTVFSAVLNVETVGVYGGNDSTGDALLAPAHTMIVDYVYNVDYPGAGDIHSNRDRIMQVNTVGNGHVSPASGAYTCGTNVTLAATADTGWEFKGWSGHVSGTFTETAISLTADRVLTATFGVLTYDLNTAIDGDGSIALSSPGPYDVDETVVVTATGDVGWVFDHWSGDAGGVENPLSLVMDSDKNVTAHFVAVDYSINTYVLGNGVVTLSPLAPYNYGQVVSVTATPNVGWVFDHWSGDVSGSLANETLTVHGNHVITGTFSPAEYTLSVTANEGGTITKDPNQPTYGYGDVVTLTATTEPGYVFVRWNGDASGNENPTTILMNADKNVQATFSELISHTITASAGMGGVVLVDPNQPEYLTGTQVSLYASPDLGWYLTDWSGDISGSDNPTTLVMNADKVLHANFSALDAGLLVSDDFDACALDGVWTFFEGLDGDPVPIISGGQMQITVPPGEDHSIWNDGVKVPRVMQSVANDDFEIVVKFDSDVTQKYQTQGVVIESPGEDAMRFEFLHDGNAVQFYAAVVKNSIAVSKHYVAVHGGGTPDYMRIQRIGDEWTHAYSFDGETWVEEVFEEPFNVTRVGVYGGNESDSGMDAPAHTVVVDYVYNTAYPGIGDIHPQYGHRLNVTVGGSGNIVQSPSAPVYACATEVTLLAEPAPGWEFSHWGGDVSGTSISQTLTMTEDYTVTVAFVEGEYDIIANQIGLGEIFVTGMPPYHYGDVVTVTATPASGWVFDGWTGTIVSPESSQILFMAQDHHITATFSIGHNNDLFLPLLLR